MRLPLNSRTIRYTQFRTKIAVTCRNEFLSFSFGRMGIRSFLRLRITSARTRVLIRRVFVALVVATIFLGGIQLRRWVGENTRHVRYQHDIVNGFYWGNEILKEARQLSPDEATANSWSGFFRGYLALYDRVKEDAYENDYHLDYPPLRLLVMAIWAKQVRNGLPVIDDGHPKLVNPLLKINLLCELLSAVAIFCLVHLCVQRSRPTRSSVLHALPQQHRAWICGLAAASVAWLEPSMILDAHGWPQWDVWILPFYLFAAIAALKNRWLWCGCLLGAGAMLKGQLLFVAPFFLLWPLWQRKWLAALHMLAGFLATTALISAPIQTAVCSRVARRNSWMRDICDRLFCGRKLCLVANRLYLRHRALSLSFHQFVLQPSLAPRPDWVVTERFGFVWPYRISGVASHTAMGAASALPWRIGVVCARPDATSARSRSAGPDCHRRALAIDVRAARPNA